MAMDKKIRFEGDVSVSSLHGPGDQRYCLIELDEILQGRLCHNNGNLLYEGDFHYGQPHRGKVRYFGKVVICGMKVSLRMAPCRGTEPCTEKMVA